MELKDQYREDNLTREPLEYYLKQYQNTSPYSISENIKLPYYEEEHAFFICFLGDTYKVSYPEFVITHETQEINIFPLEENIEAQILFSDNFPLAFSAEDVAYVGDIVIDHMKKIWKQVKE